MKSYISIFIASVFLFVSSCEKENEVNISAYNSTKSHNMGQNCMNCHKQGGRGEGWFQVAGTVYDSTQTSTYKNATVHLYTLPNGGGSLKYVIEVDGKGNFYTTNTIDFSTPLYPVVVGNLATKMMSSSITSGQCNSCHGVSTNKIWVK